MPDEPYNGDPWSRSTDPDRPILGDPRPARAPKPKQGGVRRRNLTDAEKKLRRHGG